MTQAAAAAAAAAADSVTVADGCSLSSWPGRPGIMMGHRDSLSYNFELALKFEVDPAARRPGVTVTPVPELNARAARSAGGHQNEKNELLFILDPFLRLMQRSPQRQRGWETLL